MSDSCLSLQELDRFAAHPDAATGPAVTMHLETCADCRSALRAARDDATLFAELRVAARHRLEPEPTGGLGEVPYEEPKAPTIAGYRVLDEIHRGGQGVVYVAEREDDAARVAIKVQASVSRAAWRQNARFEREISLVQSFDHPDIVPIIDSGLCENRRWFAMPLIEGLRLDEWSRTLDADDDRKDLSARIVLFRRICRAVSYAHRRGVIHRDLKPGNVLVDADGAPHILDFGIAKELGARGERLTDTGQFAGTPAYASPEQLGETPHDLTTGSDIYSLGVMLHELLSGSMPYPVDGSLAAVAANVSSAEPERLRTRTGEDYDWTLRAIVRKTLEKAPADRYPTADALADDLDRYLRGEDGDSTRWYLVSKVLRKHRRAIAATLLAFTTCLGVLGTVLYYDFRARSQRETAQQIQSVLRDILRAAGPSRMGGGATLIQILEEASQRIEGTLHRSPDVQAAVQFTIGDTYLGLMMFEDAERHLTVALQRYRELGEVPPTMLASTLHKLGVAGVQRSDRRALDRLREALKLTMLMRGDDDLGVRQIRRDIALALTEHPDDATDDGPAREDLELLRREFTASLGPRHPEVARTLHALAQWHTVHRDLSATEDCLRKALAIYDSPGGAADPWAVLCGTELASLLLHPNRTESSTVPAEHQARFAEARQLLDRSSARATRLFGDAQATSMLRQFARYHNSRGEYDIAERFSRDAVVHELRFWSQRKPEARAHLQKLAKPLAEDLSHEAARRALIESFRLFREYRGRGAYELAGWLNGLASLESSLGRSRFEEDLIRESLEYNCRVYGQDCPKRLEALTALGRLLIERGDHESALAPLESAAAILRRTNRTERPEAERVRKQIQICKSTRGGNGR